MTCVSSRVLGRAEDDDGVVVPSAESLDGALLLLDGVVVGGPERRFQCGHSVGAESPRPGRILLWIQRRCPPRPQR